MSLWRLIWAKFFSTTFLKTNVLAILFPLPSSRGCVLFKVHLRGFEPLALSQLWSHWFSLTVLLSTDFFAVQVIFSTSMSIFSAHVIFRCASISWFQVVSRWLIFFTASASTGLSDFFYWPCHFLWQCHFLPTCRGCAADDFLSLCLKTAQFVGLEGKILRKMFSPVNYCCLPSLPSSSLLPLPDSWIK